MNKLVTASLGAGALVASLASVASADPVPNRIVVIPIVRATHQLPPQTQQVGVSRIIAPQPKPAPTTDESGIDRNFHPDYAHSLSVDQMNSAWNDEVIRTMEIPQHLGGG
ncbi:MAG TPA: hypothetical protein VE591_00830 [Candidatus Acidoferrum sp.]|nr:hypothetical protein [Candidatus Acidoferrum sp.]